MRLTDRIKRLEATVPHKADGATTPAAHEFFDAWAVEDWDRAQEALVVWASEEHMTPEGLLAALSGLSASASAVSPEGEGEAPPEA